MNKGLLGCITFALGTITGAGAMYLYLKDKTNKVIDEEVQKFKDDWYDEEIKKATEDTYTVKVQNISGNIDIEKSMETAVKARNKAPITDYSKVYVTKAGEEMSLEDYMDKSGLIVDIPKYHPHVISENEYSLDSEYDKLHYILYADGILADEDGEIVNYEEKGSDDYIDPDVLYGFQIQDAIDELYYRNEEFGRDFEILKSARLYKED